MPTTIHRDQIRRLQADGATVVEVLPRSSYEQQHIEGAQSLPLGAIDEHTADRFDPAVPIITYCYDYQ